MSLERDPLDLIRSRNPVPDPELLCDDSDSAHAQALLQEIVATDARRAGRPARAGRRPRRAALLAAAAIVLTGTVAGATTGLFSPEPADVEAVLAESSGAASVHVPGWRPELSTEAVWCMVGPSEGAGTSASEYALDRPLTVDLLVAECRDGNDVARNQRSTPAAFTLCRATFTDEAYRRRLSAAGETVLAGDLQAPRPGFPVVLAWKADCERTRLETSWPVELGPLGSLDDVNRARQVEIELEAAAARACLTREEADALARRARQQLGDRWLLLDLPLDVVPDCFRVRLDAEWGAIAVWGDDTPPVGG